ncbi:hypothetical protein [Mucilaginibacter lacusdianchii]|uniref:hypothetical protein n=1 Tax=Mucilaginibacter lacusdianchii TaxID=2684211 RepID=UPI00131EC923|nr:hypothetical protein [Mucilaginibacter sp. JXJ CY 39]
MKTLVITIKTHDTTVSQKALLNIEHIYSGSLTTHSYAEAETKNCYAAKNTDDETIFGSSLKDEFMYHVAISG